MIRLETHRARTKPRIAKKTFDRLEARGMDKGQRWTIYTVKGDEPARVDWSITKHIGTGLFFFKGCSNI